MRIAIYSGTIPSTVFIETMITNVADIGYEVYIFGVVKKKHTYKSRNVRQFSFPDSKWSIIFFVLFYQLRLYFSSPKKFAILRSHIKSIEPTYVKRIRLWAKYLLPVIYLPDVFHIQWAKSIEEWFFIKNLFGVPLAVSLRGSQINISPVVDARWANAYRLLFPLVDGFHAVSKAIADKSWQFGANPAKTHVIYSPQSQSHSYSVFPSRDLHFISIGRIHWIKGYRLALESLNILKKKGVSFHYSIVGNGHLEEIQYWINYYELEKSVSLLGEKTHPEVLEAMSKSNILILSSYEEGVANVVLEAMSIGLPVVSSDCGGMSEAITHGKTGWLFQKGNANDLAEKLEICINMSPINREEMIINARKTIQEKFNKNIFQTKISVFYMEITLKLTHP